MRKATGMDEVPEVVVGRLPLYLRALKQIHNDGTEVVSSQQLGQRLHMTPAQIRKDLGYFGRFGKQGRGYNVRYLLEALRQILGLYRDWELALVGAGRLGRALIGYPGFDPEGFRIVAAFDSDPQIIGQRVGSITIQSVAEMEEVLRQRDIRIAIVAVPASNAQEVVDHLVRCGVRAILTYAPITSRAPKNVKIHYIDPVLAFQSMTYYLRPVTP